MEKQTPAKFDSGNDNEATVKPKKNPFVIVRTFHYSVGAITHR